MLKSKMFLRKCICILLCIFVFGMGFLTVLNCVVKLSVRNKMITVSEAAGLEDVDCILVLGCYVFSNGKPSAMLHDRLTRSVELYEAGCSDKLLMSGDHGTEGYDEVDAMKQFAVDAGISSENVFMDHAGFSTYESVYRAKEVFQADKIVIVTQGYHLYRALYIAEQLGLEAYGVASDYRAYAGQWVREVREILARVKDVGSCILKVKPTYLGEPIPVSGNGDLTNDATSDFYE